MRCNAMGMTSVRFEGNATTTLVVLDVNMFCRVGICQWSFKIRLMQYLTMLRQALYFLLLETVVPVLSCEFSFPRYSFFSLFKKQTITDRHCVSSFLLKGNAGGNFVSFYKTVLPKVFQKSNHLISKNFRNFTDRGGLSRC